MKNKVAELVGVMIHNKTAEEYIKNGWNAHYNDIMADPIKALREGENGGWFNKISAMALLDWYEYERGEIV